MSNTTCLDHDDLTVFAEELTSPSGVRAVAAWYALCDQALHSHPNLHDFVANYEASPSRNNEAAYDLREAIGEDICEAATLEGLEPGHDIPRFEMYMRLYDAFGTDWPQKAMRQYWHDEEGESRSAAKMQAQAAWSRALERYVHFKAMRAAAEAAKAAKAEEEAEAA